MLSSMARATWGSILALLGACGLGIACGSERGDTNAPEPTPDAATDAGTTPPDAEPEPTDGDAATLPPAHPLELHFVFVHGVGDPDSYDRSDNDLVDLEKAVMARIEARRPAYEAAHGVAIEATSLRVNLYTDDKGQVPSPNTDDGSGDEVAAHWRTRLAEKLAAAFPHGEKNIVLVGHSTGARVSMEVAADVGGASNTLGVANWGFTKRIAGVVSVHGMLDAIGGYATLGDVVPFSIGCKVVKKSGWCSYAASVSSLPASDWVATNRHSLILTSVVDDDRCGTSVWKEPSDQTLPTRAQGSPASVGLGIVADRDGVFRPSHGIPYGSFCHSDITNGNSPRHAEAVTNASTLIEQWLFDAARRVVNTTPESQTYDTPTLSNLTTSDPYTFAPGCPIGTFSGGALDLVGNCHHPGYSDGDDHAMYPEQLLATFDGRCGGTVRWKNVHDHPHAGTVWFKSYAYEPLGGLLTTLK